MTRRLRRVALVRPYSWTHPGGVQWHVSGLAAALRRTGLEVDVHAPADDPRSEGQIVPLGRSLPTPDNGSVQRVALALTAAVRTARLVRSGYDLVHLHEPMIPFTCLTTLVSARAPLVGTFHMYAASARWYASSRRSADARFPACARASLSRARHATT